jgi:predicted TIM-barrel fold metal-dependent hydrolase
MRLFEDAHIAESRHMMTIKETPMTVPIAGPDPRPKRPDMPTPPLACDCHAHIFGPSDRFPYTEGRGYTPPDAPCESYLAMLDALGIARGVCVQGNAHGYDNRAILDAASSHQDRLRAVGITDASIPQETLRDWHAKGMRGLRFHLYQGGQKPGYKRGVGLDALEYFAPTMRALGWHAQFWIDWRALPELAPTLRDIAETMPVVIDHMLNIDAGAGPDHPCFETLLGLLDDGVCWVKLSGAYRVSSNFPDYPDARPFHEALVDANPDRLVWGTDWPHPQIDAAKMPNDGHLLDLFNAWTPAADLRQKILVDNPARLYFWS